ncbi:MAG TPA: DUF58 domain-containing protein [Steroidobacteraceae bacterium]|jgi:uncharacterized protein (DUF58 family)|nr:DUF58 domain-containing protein [Steroidobacteraceae bacterium]
MNLRQNGLMLLLVTALLGIAAQWAGVSRIGNLWALPLALLMLGLAYERMICARAAMRLSIDSPDPWHLARGGKVHWQLTHSLPRTLTVVLAPQLPAGIDTATQLRTVVVPELDGTTVELCAVSRRLGKIHWPVQPARIAGPLGLAWWSVWLQGADHSMVVPAMLDLKEMASGAAAAGTRVSRVIGPGAQIEQLRDYRPGDPLRVIDWRATGRRRALVSRDFAEDQHLDVIVALDVGRSSRIQCGELDRLGHYVNAAARLAQHVVAQDDRIGLILFGDEPIAVMPPTRGHAGVMRVRDLLSGIQSQNTDSNVIHAAAQVLKRVHQRSLVVLLTDIENASSEGQLAGALRLLQPLHFPFVVGLSQLDPATIADRAPQDWLDPWLALAAAHTLRQRELGIRALRATGAQVMLTTPRDFERTLFEQYTQFRQRRRI